MQIQGASALVTGAGRGIGRAIAVQLAKAGARVTAVARTAAELDTLVAETRAGGGEAVAFRGDLRVAEVCSAAVDAAVRAHGRLSILVNNAGAGLSAPLAETTDEAWDRILGTNLTAVFRMTRAALPHLLAGGGHVFMISSLAGSNPIPGMSAYCASKAALDHLSACLMLEVRQKGVKVTVLAPGSVNTTFGDAAGSRRDDTSWMLEPEDLASTVLHLLSTRDAAHPSRIEMRPARPPKRG
jgi:NAD(P)-dependent dehydrogenase (short-subunit alcohol dehydrogenase family)